MKELIDCIKDRDIEKLKQLKKLYDIEVDPVNNKLIFKNKEELKKKFEYWDMNQNVRKILLNSTYGAILNESCIFYDERIGQSITLTGRMITKFMSEKINEIITGEKNNHLGDAIIYGDTDSVYGDAIIKTNYGDMKIEDLYEICRIKWDIDDKQYACDDDIKILGYDSNENREKYFHFNYIYKHEVEKNMFLIVDENGNELIVTEDHSLIEYSDEKILKEIKPTEIKEDTKIINI